MLQYTKRHFQLKSYFNWFARYTNTRNLPPFDKIDNDEIAAETHIDPETCYLNNLYWTPRFYQQPSLSTEFQHEMLKFRNLDVWEDKHVLAMTQLILMEATRDTTYDLSFGFKARPSPLC